MYCYLHIFKFKVYSFKCLSKCRDEVCEKLNLQKNDIELSMGMSDDFEHAVSFIKLAFT